jgi:Spy/CpxP family protein refolding chaperone
MKRWLIPVAALAAATVAAALVATAQPPGGPPPGPGALERIVDDLKLTDKQKDEVQRVLDAHHDQLRKLFEDAHNDLARQMKDILTEDQARQFKEALDRRPPGPPGGPGRGPRGVPADDLVERVLAFDKNKDGKVTKDELPERMQHLIELGDTNKDGALDKEELTRLAAQLAREQPPSPPGGPPGRGGPGAPPPGPDSPGGLERLLDDLKLTDKQQEKAHKVADGYREKMRKQLDGVRDDLLKQMKDVLGADQYGQFKDALAKLRPPPGPPPGPRGGPPQAGDRGAPPPPPLPGPPAGPGAQLDRALDDLKLADARKAKADEVLKAHHEKVRKFLDQAHEDLLQQMKKVLSEEEYKQFKESVENPRPGGPPPGPPPVGPGRE